ncbi:MAG: 6,7-dimethyl-8-ribityllumazine synthase [Spirochaetia bacterium]|nr:6,7-dimethyl-8-ribityllumazine synthase [Spirochaetia bacterium]
MKIYGEMNGSGQKHAVVTARFNEFITDKLLSGAVDALERHGVAKEDIDIIHLPGAFEMGGVAGVLAASGKYDAVTCIGAVIRGSTPHFDYVSGQAARLIAQASYDHSIPVIFGVLTTDTIEQAIERAGTKAGNKGYEAAVSAVEMASLYKKIKS